jgi:hypothetical protein
MIMVKRLMVLLLIAGSVLSSCSKDSDSATKMGATIEGASWSPSLRVTNLTNDYFIITGTATNGVLVVTIKGTAVGDYNLSLTEQKTAATFKKSMTASGDDVYASATGKVSLTKVDTANKKISGTFQFTLTNTSLQTISITSGTFNDLSFTVTPN